MATKKKVVKPVTKKPAKPVKKSAPVKPAAKKTAKPGKKPAAKPAAAKKAAHSSLRVSKSASSVSRKPAKTVTKTPAKKVASKKAIQVKKSAKPLVKAETKKTVSKPMTKKIEVKKPAPSVLRAAKPISVKKTTEKVKAAVKAAPVREKSPEKAKDIKITPAKPVVLPKINTKTSRKYQPDFTKSVLDQPVHDLGAPINRYNDTDLAEFREIIQRKLDSAKKELSYLQGLITRKDEMGGDNDDARYMTMEDGSMSMEREQLSQMASRQITFIDHLEKAVMRIENKTYGICRVTGQLIDKARLRAVPHATLSMEAKMGAAK